MKYVIAAALCVAVGVAGVAIADVSTPDGGSFTAHSAVSAGGTKKKPKIVQNQFSYDVTGPPGKRASTATKLMSSTVGLKQDGKGFPVCTAAMIDAKQSDEDCPKGSMIGTGKLTAIIGPDNNTSSAISINCAKDIHMYNTGRHTFAILGVGDPKDCANIGYIYPTVGKWINQKGKLIMDLPIPENVQHPLPGVSGYFNHSETKFINTTIGKGKKKKGYFTSYGCGKAKTRAFTWTIISDTDTAGTTETSSAGKC